MQYLIYSLHRYPNQKPLNTPSFNRLFCHTSKCLNVLNFSFFFSLKLAEAFIIPHGALHHDLNQRCSETAGKALPRFSFACWTTGERKEEGGRGEIREYRRRRRRMQEIKRRGLAVREISTHVKRTSTFDVL